VADSQSQNTRRSACSGPVHWCVVGTGRRTAAYMSARGVATCLLVVVEVELGARAQSSQVGGSDVLRSRRGVVKMLIASVSVYVVSYAPAQIPLFYNLVSTTPFRANWTFLVWPPPPSMKPYMAATTLPSRHSTFGWHLTKSCQLVGLWTFLVLLMTLSYINSAANPVLYSVFSSTPRNLPDRHREATTCAGGEQ